MTARKRILVTGILMEQVATVKTSISSNVNGSTLFEPTPKETESVFIAPIKLDRINLSHDSAEFYIDGIYIVNLDKMKKFCDKVCGFVVHHFSSELYQFDQTKYFRIKMVIFSEIDDYGYSGFLYLGPMISIDTLSAEEAHRLRIDEDALAKTLASYRKE